MLLSTGVMLAQEASVAVASHPSEATTVATVTENGRVFAVGFENGQLQRREVWNGASRSWGIRDGRLLVSRLRVGEDGEELVLVDLDSSRTSYLFPEFAVVSAEWGPRGSALAAVFRYRGETGVLIYEPGQDLGAAILRRRSVHPDLLRWSADGQELYFVESRENGLNALVRYSVADAAEESLNIEPSTLPLLAAVADPILPAFNEAFSARLADSLQAHISFTAGEPGALRAQIIESDGTLHNFSGVIASRRIAEGLLFDVAGEGGVNEYLLEDSGRLTALS